MGNRTVYLPEGTPKKPTNRGKKKVEREEEEVSVLDPMTSREILESRAKSIHAIEKRISDLIKDLKIESNVRKKLSMQQSLKTNRVIREQLLDSYWKECL